MNGILKIYVILIIIIPISVFADDDLILKVQKNVNVSHPTYGNYTFGDPKVATFKSGEQNLLVYQARYGGDGEHTPNILKVFSYKSESFSDATLVFEHNLDSVEFETRNDQLIFIKGLYIETSCFVCDGWEVSDIEGIFKIPLIIDIKDWSITVNLTQKEKDVFLERIEKLNGPKDSKRFIELKERLKQYLKPRPDANITIKCD